MCDNCNTIKLEKQKLERTINFWRPIVIFMVGAVFSAAGFYFEAKGTAGIAKTNASRIEVLERANVRLEVILEHVSKQLGEIRQDVKEIKRGK